jgi:YfiH family protein
MIIRPSCAERYPFLICALSTRQGGVSGGSFGMNLSYSVGDDPKAVTENRQLFFGSLGIPLDGLALQRQVHGDTIRRVDGPGTWDDTDGLCTAAAGIFLCVTIADCVPVFLVDPGIRAVGVVHAGWRGSAAGIAAKGVRFMAETLGADPSRMVAHIGHSAGACCYSVGPDVASRFPASCVLREDGGCRVDLKQVNRGQLMNAGLREDAITVDPACTICGADLYHSHRREGVRSGRMMGVIGIHPPG